MSAEQFSALYYDGVTPIAQPAEVTIDETRFAFIAAELAETHDRSEIVVSPRAGIADRFVTLPSGGQLQCRDHPALDRLPQESQESFVAWLEGRSRVAAAAYVLSLAAVVALNFWLLPVLADWAARRVAPDSERILGEQTLARLADSEVFAPSELELHKRETIEHGFERLIAPLSGARNYRLELRNVEEIGPNAFAFPGGIVVLTDQLLDVCNPEEAISVLAHEVGHLEEGHALRHVFRASASAALAGLISSDVSSLTLAGTTLPVTLTQLRYSREFELEADDFAYQRLKQIGISPELFASCLGRLDEYWSKERGGNDNWSFSSTHPASEERIARARAAAAQP